MGGSTEREKYDITTVYKSHRAHKARVRPHPGACVYGVPHLETLRRCMVGWHPRRLDDGDGAASRAREPNRVSPARGAS
jgi:hypothetical protein